MTVDDVRDFYQRSDAFKAREGEVRCSGCATELEAEEPYSLYVLAGKPRTPRAFPSSLHLCRKCTYMVIGSQMAGPPAT